MLINWIKDYYIRDDVFSYNQHMQFYENYKGEKLVISENNEMSEVLDNAINDNFISIILVNPSDKFNEITKQLKLTPTSTGIKGETYFPVLKNKIERTHKETYWRYEWNRQSSEFIGDTISEFITEIIIPNKDIFIQLSKSSCVRFRIVQYYYDSCNPGIVIEREDNKILSEIGASLDIDIYCLNDT